MKQRRYQPKLKHIQSYGGGRWNTSSKIHIRRFDLMDPRATLCRPYSGVHGFLVSEENEPTCKVCIRVYWQFANGERTEYPKENR